LTLRRLTPLLPLAGVELVFSLSLEGIARGREGGGRERGLRCERSVLDKLVRNVGCSGGGEGSEGSDETGSTR
jgi:hypothetical protein